MFKYAQSFCVLVEELHFSRAAARLHLTQPALSHQIKKLEEEVGCPLLLRSPHKVVVTDAGKLLARELTAALTLVDRAVEEARDVARGDAGMLAIGYCELPQAGHMTAIIRRYRELFPGVDITLHNMPTIDQIEALQKGAIDIAFLHPPIHQTNLSLQFAGEERIGAAMRADHPLANKQGLQLSDLSQERLIVSAEEIGAVLYHSIVSACSKCGFQPILREERFRWHAMLDQAAVGLGVALVPETLCSSSNDLVVFRPVQDLNIMLQTAIATTGSPVKPVVSSFMATAAAFVKSNS